MHQSVKASLGIVALSWMVVMFVCPSFAQPLQQNVIQMLRSMRFATWTVNQPEPVSHGDAPSHKTMALFSPFNAPQDPRDDGNLFSYDDALLARLQQKAAAAGYTLLGGKPFVNQQVTVKAIYDACLTSPGVIYISTHGGASDDGTYLLSTGERIPETYQTPEALNRYIDQRIQQEFGLQARAVRPFVIAGTPYVRENEKKVYYLSITNGFFDLLKKQRSDLSSSLVYIDGCEIMKSQKFRAEVSAKAILGWKADSASKLSKILAGHFWDCMVLKTRSDREAYDYAMQFTAEDPEVQLRMQHGTKGWDVKNFQLYRRDKTEPEKWFPPVYRQVLMAVRKYVCRNPQANTLEQSLKNIADNRGKNFARTGSDFFKDAYASGEPTDQQLAEIKGELCGYGSGMPRFTMIE
ncbi:MAG TPA: hypothetical protein VK448_07320 [Dissulfurispiraceae bacterium]|nr:hypothetical protein [Dissulfurispiraceae bacterium]